jgi:hypothetical protein
VGGTDVSATHLSGTNVSGTDVGDAGGEKATVSRHRWVPLRAHLVSVDPGAAVVALGSARI